MAVNSSGEEVLPVVAVYFDTPEHPGKFIAVRHWATLGRVTPDLYPLKIGDSLEEVRSVIPPGMHRFDPLHGDAFEIVETWI